MDVIPIRREGEPVGRATVYADLYFDCSVNLQTGPRFCWWVRELSV